MVDYSVHKCSLEAPSWARWIQFTPPLPICLRYIRISASHPYKKPCPPCPLSTPQPSNILRKQTRKHVSSSFDVRDEVSHLYKTFNIVVSYTLGSVSWTADGMTKYSGVAAEIPLWIYLTLLTNAIFICHCPSQIFLKTYYLCLWLW